MTRIKEFREECLIYPGKYIPLPQGDKAELNNPNAAAPLLVSMNEFVDHFIIEVVIAGYKRENIRLSVHGDILSIMVLGSTHKQNKDSSEHVIIPENIKHERKITLPSNIDAEFIKAEYSDGILRMHLPKVLSPNNINDMEVAIY